MKKRLGMAALIAGVFGLALAAQSASAQSDNEEVRITAPHFRQPDPSRLNGPLEKVSLSGVVYYNDLDLRSRGGARELRMRVRDKAAQVCDEIADAYPVREEPGTSCFKEALETGMVQANEAIADARMYRHYSYDVDYER